MVKIVREQLDRTTADASAYRLALTNAGTIGTNVVLCSTVCCVAMCYTPPICQGDVL